MTAARVRRRLCAVLLLALATGAVLPAEPSSAPGDAALAGAALRDALRAGGLVVYFRHTATDHSRDDTRMRGYDDCANQRPLSAAGRADAQAIGRAVAALRLPLADVVASPMCRTSEHARLAFGSIRQDAALREGGAGDYPGLRQLLSTAVAAGGNRWIVGHGTPFRAVAGAPHLAEGEAAVLRPLGDRGWQVLARLQVADWQRLP